MLRRTLVAGLTLMTMSYVASAQERPACPTGTKAGWNWEYDENKVMMTDTDVVVSWDMADGTQTTTRGVTLVYSWSDWSENPYVTWLKDGDQKLRVGLYVPPPSLKLSGYAAFAQGEPEVMHDYYSELTAAGQVVIPFDGDDEDGWKSTRSSYVYVSLSEMPEAGLLRDILEGGDEVFTVQLWAKSQYQDVNAKSPVGTGSFTLKSFGDLVEDLKPDVDAEMTKAKATGVYCVETVY